MNRADNGRAPQRSASFVWGLLFIVAAILTVLTSNRLVSHDAVRFGLPLALIVIGLLGLMVGSTGTRSRIRSTGAGAPGAPGTRDTKDPVRDAREHGTREEGEH